MDCVYAQLQCQAAMLTNVVSTLVLTTAHCAKHPAV
jgi:hypothetical protein